MRKIFRYFKGYWLQAVLGPLFKLLESMMELVIPILMAVVINNYLGVPTVFRGKIIELDTYYSIALMVAFITAGVIFAVTCNYFASSASTWVSYRVRRGMLRRINSMELSSLDGIGRQSLTTRITNDVNQLQHAIAMFIRLVMRTPVLAIGAMIMGFLISVKLGLIMLFTVPVVGVILIIVVKITMPKHKKVQESLDDISVILNDAVLGAKVTRAFNRQDYEVSKGIIAADEYMRRSINVNRLSALVNPISALIINFGIALIIYFSAGEVNRGAITPGEISAFITYMLWLLLALTIMANLIVMFSRAGASVKRINEVLDIPTEDDTIIEDNENLTSDSALSFSKVYYRYNEGEYVLNDIDIKIEQGRTINIIGGTGSGKSTLAKLIIRLMEPSEGSISLYGRDINDYDKNSLRNIIAYVPQKTTMFKASIKDNITIGCDKDIDIEEAIKISQADFALNKGLDYMIEENALNLSGGQIQRLAIARALVRKPKIIILDDSTSELDNLTKKKLWKGLKGLNITIINISERIDPTSDQIIVLDKGRVIGIGTHEELINNPVYLNMYEMQRGLRTA